MKKSDFLDTIASTSGVSRASTEKVVKAIEELVYTKLKKNEKVTFPGIGYFHTTYRPSRYGHNPRTRENIVIQARYTPLFRFTKTLKDHIREES